MGCPSSSNRPSGEQGQTETPLSPPTPQEGRCGCARSRTRTGGGRRRTVSPAGRPASEGEGAWGARSPTRTGEAGRGRGGRARLHGRRPCHRRCLHRSKLPEAGPSTRVQRRRSLAGEAGSESYGNDAANDGERRGQWTFAGIDSRSSPPLTSTRSSSSSDSSMSRISNDGIDSR